MKRKRQPGKLTYSELRAAGHHELADHVLWQRKNTISVIRCSGRPRSFKPNAPPERRFLIPTP